MSDIFDRLRHESDSVFERLRDAASVRIHVLSQDVALAVTGSLAKGKCTRSSDIDLLVMTADAEVDASSVASRIASPHPIEQYAAADESQWRWMVDHSELIASDLHFARFLAGNETLFRRIHAYASEVPRDHANRRGYLTHNVLYRSRQSRDGSLKYRDGGLRDVQLLDWAAKRIAGSAALHPEEQASSLVACGLLQEEDMLPLVSRYADLLRCKQNGETYPEDPDGDTRLADIMRRFRSAMLCAVGDDAWCRPVIDVAEHRQTASLLPADPSHACAMAWQTADQHRLAQIFDEYHDSWAVRAALALHPHASATVRRNLSALSYPDMADIHAFLSSSPYSHGHDSPSVPR